MIGKAHKGGFRGENDTFKHTYTYNVIKYEKV